jgi:hypothetical protein
MNSEPGDDNPVEALIRHRIEVHSSPKVVFLHDLMAVLLTVTGIGVALTGVFLLFTGGDLMISIMPIAVGAFLAFWGPYARRQIREDTARKSAAALHQLEQAKTWRRRNGY